MGFINNVLGAKKGISEINDYDKSVKYKEARKEITVILKYKDGKIRGEVSENAKLKNYAEYLPDTCGLDFKEALSKSNLQEQAEYINKQMKDYAKEMNVDGIVEFLKDVLRFELSNKDSDNLELIEREEYDPIKEASIQYTNEEIEWLAHFFYMTIPPSVRAERASKKETIKEYMKLIK